MHLFSLADPSHALHAFQLNDSSLALIALLVGMGVGWSVTGWREQLKARRAKIERSRQGPASKPD